MDYQVYSPSEAIQPFVKCFWTLEAAAIPAPAKQRVLPDGCMEMIFHYGDLYRQYLEDGSTLVQPRSFIFGQITHKYIEIEPLAVTGIVAARFHPCGLIPFLVHHPGMLENKAVALDELFGAAGKELEEKVIAAESALARIALIESFLLSRMSAPNVIDHITRNCVTAILQSHGQLGMEELAGKMLINRRQMERKLSAGIGMSPKQLSKAVRLQATLRRLEQQQFGSLTSLAYENGYYDQAHFIRDFKEFTGMSPKSFFAGNLRFAAFFASAE